MLAAKFHCHSSYHYYSTPQKYFAGDSQAISLARASSAVPAKPTGLDGFGRFVAALIPYMDALVPKTDRMATPNGLSPYHEWYTPPANGFGRGKRRVGQGLSGKWGYNPRFMDPRRAEESPPGGLLMG